MNREILFKAKRIDWRDLSKEQWWVEGDVQHTTSKNIILIVVDDYKAYPCDSSTLCQYIGLTDKNGNKIFENDILIGHGNDRDLSKVSFGKFYVIDVETLNKVDEVIGWHTEVIETDALSKCEPFCLPMPLTDFYIKRSEFEVFGNIFDNADLMEVE